MEHECSNSGGSSNSRRSNSDEDVVGRMESVNSLSSVGERSEPNHSWPRTIKEELVGLEESGELILEDVKLDHDWYWDEQDLELLDGVAMNQFNKVNHGARGKRKRSLSTVPGTVDLETGVSQSFDGSSNSVITNLPLPPRTALDSDLHMLDSWWKTKSKTRYMRITEHPPLEVRTRTKNENRTFACAAEISPTLELGENQTATIRLCNLQFKLGSKQTPKLGGTLIRSVKNGKVRFDDLSLSVSSTKNEEREFTLEISLDNMASKGNGGDDECYKVYSRSIYAFSNKSVLKRRRELELRALSHSQGSSQRMHVVGTPFVRSDRLQCVFRIPKAIYEKHCSKKPGSENDEWVSLHAENLDFFSETVLFFTPPFFPERVEAFIQVTNDGRNYSNPLPFTLLPPTLSRM